MNHPPFLWVVVAAAVGCGGNVVFVDDGGEGGAGAGSTTIGPGPGPGPSSVSSSVATGLDCSSLEQAYLAAFAEATACNGCLDIDDCVNGGEITDSCGCPARALYGVDAAQAQQAYDDWVAAGCGPYLCGVPCVGPGASWFCVGTGDCTGTCAAATGL